MNSLLRMPIGIDIFGEIIEKKMDFVDKSLFVKSVLDDTAKIIIITRPRRFGKTLNLSMLQHFFAQEAYGLKTQGLFNGLKIAKDTEVMQHQGKYPVIFISLKDLKDHSFEHSLSKLKLLVAEAYAEHSYLLTSDKLQDFDKEAIHTLLRGNSDQALLENSLRNLTLYLTQHHGIKPWLLIDEYDSPIQSAFLHGYYPQMINLMRNFLSAALKTNPYLEKSVLTGILRVSKESLFSGLNNVEVHTLLSNQYSDYFGFTEQEIQTLLSRAGLEQQSTDIRDWYNGYQAGKTIIYNPWSIMNCLVERGKLSGY